MHPDIVLPSIIVGLIVTMVLGFQMLIVESSVDNRLQSEMQSNSALALELIREEIRGLDEILSEPDNTLVFRTFAGDSVSISRSGRNLVINRHFAHSQATDNISHPLNLSVLEFSVQPDSMPYEFANFIRVFLETSSNPDQHVASSSHKNSAKSRSQTDFFLRHKAAVN